MHNQPQQTHPEYYDDLLDKELVDRDYDICHVVPIDDTYPHRSSAHCWCHPKSDTNEYGDEVWVHNAYDGRESYEEL